VKVDANGNLALCAAGDNAVGVLQNKPTAAGQTATVGALGIAKVKAGVDLVAGDPISAGANGVAVKSTSGKKCLGVALEPVVAGGLARILLKLSANDTLA